MLPGRFAAGLLPQVNRGDGFVALIGSPLADTAGAAGGHPKRQEQMVRHKFLEPVAFEQAAQDKTARVTRERFLRARRLKGTVQQMSRATFQQSSSGVPFPTLRSMPASNPPLTDVGPITTLL